MESFKDTLFPHVLTYARTYVCVCVFARGYTIHDSRLLFVHIFYL